MIGPDDLSPTQLPDRLRDIARRWLARSGDPLNELDNNPRFAQECVIVAADLHAAAVRLESRLLSELTDGAGE